MTITMTLHSWGRLDWADIVGVLRGSTAAWADYGGFHLGPCPADAPPYSHLWAWTEDWRFRVRIDEDGGYLAALGDSTPPPSTPETVAPSHGVVVREAHGIPWGDDGQVPKRVTELASTIKTIHLFETLEPMPMTFVSVTLNETALHQ